MIFDMPLPIFEYSTHTCPTQNGFSFKFFRPKKINLFLKNAAKYLTFLTGGGYNIISIIYLKIY